MIEAWKDWTGARHIYLHIPYDLGLQRISLFKKIAPNSMNSFTYVVIAECLNVNTEDKKVNINMAQNIYISELTTLNVWLDVSDYTIGFRSKNESRKVPIRLPVCLRAL